MVAQPFRILILGDFSGRGTGTSAIDTAGLPCPPRSTQKLLRVDRDNFAEILSQLAPVVTLPLRGGQVVTLSFQTLDDFHPDQLFAGLEVFASSRALRKRLLDPQTFAQAAEELRGPSAVANVTTEAPPVGVPLPASLLRHALPPSGPPSSATASVSQVLDWSAFLRRYVDPISVARPDARLQEVLANFDDAVSQLLREILHHRQFQALEATWRGLEWLVRRLETGAEVQLFLYDATLEEISSNPSSLIDRLPDLTPASAAGNLWSLIVADYECNASEKGVLALRALGQLANQVQAPAVTGADCSWLGVSSLPEWIAATPSPGSTAWLDTWKRLRRESDFQRVGLAVPRFLLRRPYGAKSDPIGSLPFEEVPLHEHGDYLWGSPIWIAAYLSGASVLRYGSWHPGDLQLVEELPIHIYSDDGDPTMLPCAEVLLTEDHMSEMFQWGIMPLLSVVNQACVRWPRFYNVATEPWGFSR